MDSLTTYHNTGLPAALLQLGARESKLTGNTDVAKSFASLMKHGRGISLVMQVMVVPFPLQTTARMDLFLRTTATRGRYVSFLS